MSEIREKLVYSDEHEWTEKVQGNIVKIGITDYAQSELGDIVFVELPEIGDSVEAGESFGTIESVKSVSELYCPVDGKVTKINEALLDSPELVNESPYENGWIIEVEVDGDLDEALNKLLSAEAYKALIEE